uniref:Uncharacterized protein n=1 Tax=Rhizophora mucronata TaxID=61149 RepID=A0A2P2N9P5_RHIMU
MTMALSFLITDASIVYPKCAWYTLISH